MGLYVNPSDMSKEEWLEKNSVIRISKGELSWDTATENGHLPVCLIDNGPFSAAGVAFSEEEYNVFLQPDGRPKTWYLVSKERLQIVCPEFHIYIKDFELEI